MSLRYHHGVRLQHGRGIGSLFGGLMRFLKPIASMGFNVGKKILGSDVARKLGSAALDVGKSAARDIAVDLLEGKPFKESTREHMEEAKKVIANTIKGSGKHKKRKRKQITCKTTCNKRGKYNLLK